MNKAISFKQLKKEYQTGDMCLIKVKSKKQALNDIQSKTSCCWNAGRKLGETGWVQLASPSKMSKNDKRTIFVCLESLIKS